MIDPKFRTILVFKFGVMFLGLGGLAVSLEAHDFWIEPESYRIAPGEPQGLWLRVGDSFQGQKVASLSRRIDRFWIRGPEGLEKELRILERRDPAAIFEGGTIGGYEIAYSSRPKPHSLAAHRFRRYLQEEGLEGRVDLKVLEKVQRPIRERFRRCAKTWLAVGSPLSKEEMGPPLGLTLELMPLRVPNSVNPGESLSLQLLFEGQPLVGAQVVAIPRADPGSRRVSVTSDQGEVEFRIHRSGPWLIKAVHLESSEASSEYDYESWWASLTFEVPGKPAPTVSEKP